MSASNDPGRFDRAIDTMVRGGATAHVPLIEAMKAGLIDMVYVNNRSASLPFGRIRKSNKPVLVLIGDDDDLSSGPDGWRCARQVTQWAKGMIVHGSGAQRAHYELAVRGAVACRQFRLIDTASRHALAWATLLAHADGVVIMPNDGPHPIAEATGTVH